jgi:hypothetical protein
MSIYTYKINGRLMQNARFSMNGCLGRIKAFTYRPNGNWPTNQQPIRTAHALWLASEAKRILMR